MAAERSVLRSRARSLPQPWHGAMEATIFSAWIYDTLNPYAQQLDMGHPAKMKAITAGKKKSNTIEARTIADLVRCNLLPSYYMFSPRVFPEFSPWCKHLCLLDCSSRDCRRTGRLSSDNKSRQQISAVQPAIPSAYSVRRTVQIARQPSFNAEGLLGVEAGGARGGHPNGEKGNQA